MTVNPVERAIRGADRVQQRNRAAAFVYGVIKKFGDDNGGTLTASLAHSAFLSLFPLLLILVTVLGLVVSGNQALYNDVLHAVAKQFPAGGDQLTNISELRRSSTIGLIIGLLGLLWGATGLAQAALFTMEQVWNLPGPARPGFLPRLGRSLLFLVVLGVGIIVTTLLTSLDTFGHNAVVLVVLAVAAAVLANVGLYFVSFRVLTPKGVPSRALLPGAAFGGAAWTLLQAIGSYLVHHFLHSSSVYGVFATVLALIAWISLGVQLTVYAAEVNVVLERRLWPRSIIQPPLTEADRAALALQALQNQRRDEQQVLVSFTDRPRGTRRGRGTPRTPGEIAPPAGPGRRPAEPGDEGEKNP